PSTVPRARGNTDSSASRPGSGAGSRHLRERRASGTRPTSVRTATHRPAEAPPPTSTASAPRAPGRAVSRRNCRGGPCTERGGRGQGPPLRHQGPGAPAGDPGIQRKGAGAGGGEEEEDEAEEDGGLALVDDGPEALGEVPDEIGESHLA